MKRNQISVIGDIGYWYMLGKDCFDEKSMYCYGI